MNNTTIKWNKPKKYENRGEAIAGFLMACGPFVGYLIFGFFPLAMSLYLSFTDMFGFDLFSATWVGFKNYSAIFRDEDGMIRTAILNSLYYCLSVPINMLMSLFIANLLTKGLKGSGFARTILFIPSVCSSVGVTLMWSWILDSNFGVANTILVSMGLAKIPFISSAQWFMPSVLLISAWQNGTNIVLMQAALRNVRQEICEAAKVDGAKEITVFWKIIVPCITPTLFYLLVTQLVAAIQEMSVMQIISGNGYGPANRAVTLSYYMYLMSWRFYSRLGIGMASALSWVVAIAVIIFTRLNFRLSAKWVCYD